MAANPFDQRTTRAGEPKSALLTCEHEPTWIHKPVGSAHIPKFLRGRRVGQLPAPSIMVECVLADRPTGEQNGIRI